jgi:hypothetical protein
MKYLSASASVMKTEKTQGRDRIRFWEEKPPAGI